MRYRNIKEEDKSTRKSERLDKINLVSVQQKQNILYDTPNVVILALNFHKSLLPTKVVDQLAKLTEAC